MPPGNGVSGHSAAPAKSFGNGSNRLQVCFVAPQVPSPAHCRRGYAFLHYLAGQGHQVTLHCLNDTGPVSDAGEQLAALGIEVHVYPLPLWQAALRCSGALLWREPLRVAYCRSKKLCQALRSDLQTNHYDVVHIDRFRMIPHGLVAESVYSGPVVYDFPDSLSFYYQRALRYPAHWRKQLINRLEAATIRKYEQDFIDREKTVVVCSELDAAHLREICPKARLHVIPNMVDTDCFAPHPKPTGVPELVFTGTLRYQPNVDSLVWYDHEIRPLLDSQTTLKVIGYGNSPELRSLQNRPCYHFTGYVERMADHLFPNDIYICPLRIGAGIRNKLLEAFACGMAVVSTALGAEGIACQAGEHLLIADTPQQFADAIKQLQTNPELRTKLGCAARELVVKRYSESVAGCQLEALYRSLQGAVANISNALG